HRQQPQRRHGCLSGNKTQGVLETPERVGSFRTDEKYFHGRQWSGTIVSISMSVLICQINYIVLQCPDLTGVRVAPTRSGCVRPDAIGFMETRLMAVRALRIEDHPRSENWQMRTLPFISRHPVRRRRDSDPNLQFPAG